MRSSSIIMTLLTYAIRSESHVSALPDRLIARQCDTLICPEPDKLWNTLGIGAEWLLDTFLRPAPDTNFEDRQQQTAPQYTSIPFSDPQIELQVEGKPSEQDECQPPSDPNQVSPAENPDFSLCGTASRQLIWPERCGDATQNGIIGKILGDMDNQLISTLDPLCPVKDGVAFWQARLTQEQITALRQDQIEAVREITPNTPFKFAELMRGPPDRANPAQPIPTPINHKRDRQLQNRLSSLTVIKQADADMSLRFLSSAESLVPPSSAYAYFSQAGAGVRVYVIDTGLDGLANDFINKGGIRWINADDVPGLQRDEDRVTGHGTCMASKIAGEYYGVAKAVSLIIVKISPLIGSFLDALGKIMEELQQFGKKASRGWTVINVSGTWPAPLDPQAESQSDSARMLKLIANLVEEYEVVLVAQAGSSDGTVQAEYGDVDTWPALLSERYPIITVGAVSSDNNDPEYGKRFPWSLGGNAISVSAPGNGFCTELNGRVEYSEGSSFAGAVVSGLVAYFLSIPQLNSYFRSLPAGTLPGVVRDYVKRLEYKRYQAQESVWSGLDANQASPDYLQLPGLMDPAWAG